MIVVAPLLLCALAFLPAGRAGNVTCTVVRGPDKTITYGVQHVKVHGCEYEWANMTSTLAHQSRQAEGVKEKNETSMTTNVCYDQVSYKRTCNSENYEEITAVCSLDCEATSEHKGRNETIVMTTVAAPFNVDFGVAVGIAVGVVAAAGLVVVVAFLIHRNKRRIKRFLCKDYSLTPTDEAPKTVL